MRLIVTRPEPDGTAFAERLEAMGHEAVVEPLMRVGYKSVNLPQDNVQSFIFTSRNALRWVLAYEQRERMTGKPAFVVGPATRRLAKEAGFSQIFEGCGDARGLSGLIKKQSEENGGTIIHISGEEVAVDLVPELRDFGLQVERAIVYSTAPREKLTSETLNALGSGEIDGVVLMSPKTSRVWVKLISDMSEQDHLKRLKAFCISSAAAAPLKKLQSVSIRIAKKPNIEELLALIDAEASGLHNEQGKAQ